MRRSPTEDRRKLMAFALDLLNSNYGDHRRPLSSSLRRRISNSSSASREEMEDCYQLGEQLFTCICIFDEDRADGAVLGRLQDLLNGVSRGIDGLRLTVFVEPEDLGRDGLAHRIADAHVVVDADAQLAGHWRSPNAR